MIALLKFLHLLGVALLVGDVMVVALCKILGDRSGRIEIRHFAQRVLLLSDKVFLIPAIILLMLAGHALVAVTGIPIWRNSFMLAAQACFVLSGLLWWFLLVPLQKRQMAQLEQALQSGILDPTYDFLSRQWNIYGVLAMAFMVFWRAAP